MASLILLAFALFAGAVSASELRIVGGESTSVNEWPSIAQVEFLGTASGIWTQSCGASILTSRYSLSAAQCFSGIFYEAKNRRIRAGTSYRHTGGQVSYVEYAFNHQLYGQNDMDADITVVLLKEPFVYNPNLQQVTIVPQGYQIPPNVRTVIAGWGATQSDIKVFSRHSFAIVLKCYVRKMAAVFWAVILLAGFSCTSAKLGSPAKIEDFPSVVQVENIAATIWLQQCVGSVLTSYHVLSAASCFSGVGYNANTRRIRAGTSTRGYGGSVVEVYHVYIHPSYGQGVGNDGDIAVVRLNGYLQLGGNIQQASILGEGIQLPVALPVTLVGWGTTAEGGLIGNNDLYSIDLATVYEGKCLYDYQNSDRPQVITENMICAGLPGVGGRDLDTRDAGAPIFYSGVTVGVVSFGQSYADDKYPVVSTSVGSYTAWIVEKAAV
ncbi:unnamed protein product [Chrysodeixis includens]|uniref:Peptidase S1 domain-containing protein n=1 Tax=Chrysodeixis includens TaxID=689277 RepID=A0A9N8L700_CHRIL|nr:unnamed protein product [Chrysodeixis includens]